VVGVVLPAMGEPVWAAHQNAAIQACSCHWPNRAHSSGASFQGSRASANPSRLGPVRRPPSKD